MPQEFKRVSQLRVATTLPAGAYVLGFDPNWPVSVERTFRFDAGLLASTPNEGGGGDNSPGEGGSSAGVGDDKFFGLLELSTDNANKVLQSDTFYSDSFVTNATINKPLSTRAVYDAALKKYTPTVKDASVILHFEGTPNDNSANAIVDVNDHVFTLRQISGDNVGVARLSSDFVKFGNTAILVSNGGSIKGNPNVDYGVGTGDFTFEIFTYNTGATGTLFENRIFDVDTGDFATGFSVQLSAGKLLLLWDSPAKFLLGTQDVSARQEWTHLAVVRKEGVVTAYVNGVQEFTGAMPEDLAASSPFYLFINSRGRDPLGGYFDELRFGKVAYYSAPFTVPTQEFTVPPSNTEYTLINNAWQASAVPEQIGVRIVARTLFGIVEPPFELNTHIAAQVSRDGGTTFSPVVLSEAFERANGNRVLMGAADVSSQPAGQDVVYRLDMTSDRAIELSYIASYID